MFLQRKETQRTLKTDPGELSMEKQKINNHKDGKDGSSAQDGEKKQNIEYFL